MCKWKKGFIVFGGEKNFNRILKIRDCFSDIKHFDTARSEWKTIRPSGEILEPRRNQGACIFEKNLIIMGGINNHGKMLDHLYITNLGFMP